MKIRQFIVITVLYGIVYLFLILGDSVTLLCSNCKETFSSPFDLMVHVQSMHFMNIFHVGSTDASTNTAHKVVQLLNNEENNETYQENHRREENQQVRKFIFQNSYFPNKR